MGVQNLHSFLHENKCIIKDEDIKMKTPQIVKHKHYLYVDLNSFIYEAWKNVDNHDNAETKSIKNLEIILIEFFKELKKYDIIKNEKTKIYLFLDGIAPLGKVIQQRNGRYTNYLNNDLKSIHISVGSSYMEKVRKELGNKFGKIDMEDGEGEHKIISKILVKTANLRYHFIFSNDTDVLFLIYMNLGLGKENHFLKYTENKLLMYNYNKFYEDTQLDASGRIQNGVFIFMLFGNDYVPQILKFKIIEENKFIKIEAIKKLMNRFEIIKYVQTKYYIDWNEFKELLKNLPIEFINNNDVVNEYNEEIIRNYLETLEWTFRYYDKNSNIHYNTFYKGLKKPPFIDHIIHYIENNNPNENPIQFNFDDPQNNIIKDNTIQQMLILPKPYIYRYVDPKYHELMETKEYRDYFDMFNDKSYDGNSNTKIFPFMNDYKKFSDSYNKIKNFVDPITETTGDTILYRENFDKIIIIKSSDITNSGKSTISLHLIQRFLIKKKYVLFIDIDPGQNMNYISDKPYISSYLFYEDKDFQEYLQFNRTSCNLRRLPVSHKKINLYIEHFEIYEHLTSLTMNMKKKKENTSLLDDNKYICIVNTPGYDLDIELLKKAIGKGIKKKDNNVKFNFQYYSY